MRIDFKRARLSVRFGYVFFPISYEELVELLREAGYQVTAPPSQLVTGPSGRIEASGPIASKAGLTIDVDTERGIVGLSSSLTSEPGTAATELEFAVKAFDEIEGLLKRFVQGLPWNVRFYEVILDGSVSEVDVRGLLDRLANNRVFSTLMEIWGAPVTNYGVRLVPLSQLPNQEEWFDIRIEPELRRSQDLIFEGILRSADKTKVTEFTLNFASRLSETLLQLLQA